jgi:hypothetical protein
MNVFLPVIDLIDKIKEFFPVELQEEYIAFVRKLETENVSLHNKIIAAQMCLDGSADQWPQSAKKFVANMNELRDVKIDPENGRWFVDKPKRS